ncbi:hypothetical protein Ancab_003738 [Ancistrocladus abbreviatus]
MSPEHGLDFDGCFFFSGRIFPENSVYSPPMDLVELPSSEPLEDAQLVSSFPVLKSEAPLSVPVDLPPTISSLTSLLLSSTSFKGLSPILSFFEKLNLKRNREGSETVQLPSYRKQRCGEVALDISPKNHKMVIDVEVPKGPGRKKRRTKWHKRKGDSKPQSFSVGSWPEVQVQYDSSLVHMAE